MTSRLTRLSQCVKQTFIIEFIGGEGVLDDLLGDYAAFTALAGGAKLFANFTQARGTVVHRVADLAVGDAFANAYVHK